MSNYIYYNYMYEQNAVTYPTIAGSAKGYTLSILQLYGAMFVITLYDFS